MGQSLAETVSPERDSSEPSTVPARMGFPFPAPAAHAALGEDDFAGIITHLPQLPGFYVNTSESLIEPHDLSPLARIEQVRQGLGTSRLIAVPELARKLGFAQGVNLYLKLLGDNPSGTHKDYIAAAHVADVIWHNAHFPEAPITCVVAPSCGNYGSALALACQRAGLACIIVVPEKNSYNEGEIEAMQEQYGAQVRRIGEHYPDAVLAARAIANGVGFYDASPGGDNSALQRAAFGEVAFEIVRQLNESRFDTEMELAGIAEARTELVLPRAVAVPVSNGTTLAGIWDGFRAFGESYHVDERSLPRMLAGFIDGQNPIGVSFLHGKTDCIRLAPDSIRITAINEALADYDALDGVSALEALRASRGAALPVTDRDLESAAINIEACGISGSKHSLLDILTPSAAGLVALIKSNHALQYLRRLSPRNSKYPDGLPPGDYVVVITGEQDQNLEPEWLTRATRGSKDSCAAPAESAPLSR